MGKQRFAKTRLAEWLAGAKVRQIDFAARVGISPEFLSLVVKGVRGLSYETACRVSTATGGVVTVSELLSKQQRAETRRRRQVCEASP